MTAKRVAKAKPALREVLRVSSPDGAAAKVYFSGGTVRARYVGSPEWRDEKAKERRTPRELRDIYSRMGWRIDFFATDASADTRLHQTALDKALAKDAAEREKRIERIATQMAAEDAGKGNRGHVHGTECLDGKGRLVCHRLASRQSSARRGPQPCAAGAATLARHDAVQAGQRGLFGAEDAMAIALDFSRHARRCSACRAWAKSPANVGRGIPAPL